MILERYYQLMTDVDSELTPEEVAEGWHFCYDWDGLLVNKYTSPERTGCLCDG